MGIWSKVWSAAGLVLLTACGGGGDGGSSSSTQASNVSSSDAGSGTADNTTTVVSTLDFNVSQVFTNWYSNPSSFTMSGQITGKNEQGNTETVTLQLLFKRNPLSDTVFNAQAAKRSSLVLSGTVDGVAFSEVGGDNIDYFSTGPFRLLGSESPFTSQVNGGPITQGVVRGIVQDAVAAPFGVKVGSTGPLGSATLIRYPESTIGPWVYDVEVYSYSVEAASSVDTAWVCQKTLSRDSKGRLDSEHKFCLLSNANSDVLGLRYDWTEYDLNGGVLSSATLR
jgi:hypothetical protein